MFGRFSLGKLVATPAALQLLAQSGQTPNEFLERHSNGDWGDMDDEDRKLNDDALVHGGRIFSAYTTKWGDRIWLITEADRSSSCLLRPEDY